MAEIKTIYKGESVTLLFTLPELYDMEGIESHKVFIGETEFAGVKDGQTIKLQLKSSDTDRMIGTHKVVLWIDDAVLGLRKPYCGDLVVAKTQASGSTASVSNISDIIIPIVISETAITAGDILYNYVKGDKGDTGKYGETKFVINDNMELEQHTLIGYPLNFAIVDDELVLTEEGETVNLGKVVYTNPNVIDMQKGEYLMDIVNTINALPEAEKPTAENPITINFYNHNKTIDWSRYEGIIQFPEHVYLNFIGTINAFDNSDLFTNEFSLPKMFLGFSFARDSFKLSGLPQDLKAIPISGNWEEPNVLETFAELDNFLYSDLIYETQPFVYCVETKELYFVKPNNEKLICTVSLVNCNMINSRNIDMQSVNNQGAYFYYTNNQGANFGYTNNQGANFGYANNQRANFQYTNNQGANFGYTNNQGANFVYANNQGANFQYTNNQWANFGYANNQGANFGYANNQGANFQYTNNQWAFFYSANNQGANFGYANLKQVNWDSVVSIVNANFHNADLTGGYNLPERINTKAKWIAECGANNVNAETIWIDGTSILS